MSKNNVKIIISFILFLLLGSVLIIYNFLPSEDAFKKLIGENANLFGVLAFFGFSGLAFVGAIGDNAVNWLSKTFPNIFPDIYIDLKWDEFVKRVGEFKEDRKKEVLKNTTQDKLERGLKEILTNKYDFVLEFLKTYKKNTDAEYFKKIEEYYSGYYADYNYIDVNAKTEYQTALKNTIFDKKYKNELELEDWLENYEKRAKAKFEKNGAKYLAKQIFNKVLELVDNKGCREILDVLALVSFRYLVNEWEKKVSEELKDPCGNVLIKREEFWKNKLDLKLVLEVPEISVEALQVFLVEMEVVAKNENEKEKVDKALDFLAKIDWIEYRLRKQSLVLNTQVLDLLEHDLIEGAKALGKITKYDTSTNGKLYKKGCECREKDDYDLAFLFRKPLMALNVLNKDVLATDYANHLSNLALVYGSQGKYIEAEELYKQAVEIDKKTIGENHPNFAIRLNNLGGMYHEWGQEENDRVKLELAQKYLQQALTICTEKLGRDHPNTKDTQIWLNDVNEELEKWE